MMTTNDKFFKRRTRKNSIVQSEVKPFLFNSTRATSNGGQTPQDTSQGFTSQTNDYPDKASYLPFSTNVGCPKTSKNKTRAV